MLAILAGRDRGRPRTAERFLTSESVICELKDGTLVQTTLRDASATGARIEWPADQLVPRSMTMHLRENRTIHATVARKDGNMLGVRFELARLEGTGAHVAMGSLDPRRHRPGPPITRSSGCPFRRTLFEMSRRSSCPEGVPSSYSEYSAAYEPARSRARPVGALRPARYRACFRAWITSGEPTNVWSGKR